METLDEDIILEFIDEKPEYIYDYAVLKAKSAKNINEIGIFKVEKEKIIEFHLFVQSYVIHLQESYRTMDYFPEEIEKIENATVKIKGNYIIYSFLNEKDTKKFYKAIEKVLK